MKKKPALPNQVNPLAKLQKSLEDADISVCALASECRSSYPSRLHTLAEEVDRIAQDLKNLSFRR